MAASCAGSAVSLPASLARVSAPARFPASSAAKAAADGLPTSITVRGFTPKGDAAESFTIADGQAKWKSPIDAGSVSNSAPAFYVPYGGPMQLTALGILKRIYFAGGMHYDTPVTATDGLFAVNVWERMDRSAIVGLILALYRGQFTGRKHTQAHRTRRVRIAADTPIDFELDGEVSKVSQVDVEVVPRAVRLCG